MLKKAYYNFAMDKWSVIILALIFIWFQFQEYIYFSRYTESSDTVTGFDYLQSSLGLCLYLFIGFMLSSYFYSLQLYRSELRLMLSKRLFRKICNSYMAVMLTFVLLFFVTALAWNISVPASVYGRDNALISRIFFVCLLYFFFYFILAVVLGMVMAQVKKRINSIFILLFTILLISPLPELLTQIRLPGDNGIGSYKMLNWIQVGPRSLNVIVDSISGISAHYTRFFVLLLWITFFYAILLFKRELCSIGHTVACVIIMLICVAGISHTPCIGDEVIKFETNR